MLPFWPVWAFSLQRRGLLISLLFLSPALGLRVLECASNAPIPHSRDPRITTFNSLTAFCGENPGGMGYVCPQNNGPPLSISPPTALYRGPPNPQPFQNACLNNCWCQDLAPGLPLEIQAQRPQQCSTTVASSDESGDEEVNQPAAACEYRDPDVDDHIHCDAFYGSPETQACRSAQDLLDSEEHDPMQDSREFLAQSVAPHYNGFILERTPQHYPPNAQPDGCTVTVDLIDASGNVYQTNDLDNWNYLWGRAGAIIWNCVIRQGVGGWTPAGDQNNALGVYVHSTNSEFQQFLDLKYACVPDAEGNAVCDSDEPDPKRQKTGSSGSVDPDGSSNPGSAPQPQCGASCLNNSECDVSNDCICDTDFTAPPTDPSFGTSKCRYRPHASTILAAAASLIKLGSCRGRCLVGANGTLEIPANDTVPVAPPAPNIATIANVSTPATLEPSLTCPCNCTYVSHACCLSPNGIVLEDSTQKIQTPLLAPNGSICCDGTTGRWAPAPVQRDSPAKNPLCPPTPNLQKNPGGSGVVHVGK